MVAVDANHGELIEVVREWFCPEVDPRILVLGSWLSGLFVGLDRRQKEELVTPNDRR